MFKKSGAKPTGTIEEVGHYNGDKKPKVEAGQGQTPDMSRIDWKKVGKKDDASSGSKGS
jgi:hypothetical protein